MDLPAGVIFSCGKPCYFEGFFVKGETMGNDFTQRSLDDFEAPDSGDWADNFDDMLENNVSVPIDKDYGRQGLFDDEHIFLVYEDDDLDNLLETINEAKGLLK